MRQHATRSLRILAIAPTGFFADYGCHVRIRGQMGALAARGHHIRIVTYPSGRDVDELTTLRPPFWPRGRTMPVGSSRRKLLLDAWLAALLPVAARRFPAGRPDIIHAYLHEGALLGALVSRAWRVPLVFDYQGSLSEEMLDHRFLSASSPLLPSLRRLERWINRQPQAILASSAQATRQLIDGSKVSPQRVSTLPDNVDPAQFRPRAEWPAEQLAALRHRLDLPTGRPLLVYLGLLAPYQGTELLLQAMQRLARRDPAPHCLIMGFPDVDHYRKLAHEMGLDQHVTFTGAVSYEEAPLHLALGDVAVAPKVSATEGSGKLLPYMAAGLPIAAFDTPVHGEYLGDLGFYARLGDAKSLAGTLERALSASADEKARRGWLLRARVIERYTWQHAAQEIEDRYRSLMCEVA
ncbi:MAG: glycosyltransferase family 4 protein [Anaerolineae bacterium]|nr:glycosyltransferase family 4 protein [Anaerolineae bacterium]